jgi:NAD(P)-dependent dehydrogenase (short-subunit alcohol dehydrogenase family)
METGASSGMGAATAKYFVAKGWNVAAIVRSPFPETSSIKDYTAFIPKQASFQLTHKNTPNHSGFPLGRE